MSDDLFLQPAEVSATPIWERLSDGSVVRLHPSVCLGEETRNTVRAIHSWTDVEVARQLSDGAFHPGTALAVMMIYRDAVRDLDPALAEAITPRLTELAASARPMVPPLPEAPR